MSSSPYPPVTLLPATIEHLEALQRGRDELAAMLSTEVPDAWPAFPESVPFTLDRLRRHPDEAGWWMHLFLDPATGALIGSGGFAGPPADRTVELGYEIAPAFRGRRFGVGAAAALLDKAAASGEVDAVIAHTMPEPSASTRVLAGLGFVREAELTVPDEGPVARWRRELG